ncbi:hypothetical protein BK809_0007645 [Diplodia seriata]|uniref:Myb-like domain-containing protein n=1 Tax=Diplodia seriata TaxID=420778 RepID=A0A1S8BJX8_9PEZI|nr:hypothetical protein BK809_0007645 [Diplodia seriata]
MAHRPRLPPPADAEHYDDLSDLERERHQNDMRLKNTFEHIFDKYERDFTDIGDEVDLETGEIVVNNGHLARLEDERDTGEGFEEWYEEDDDDVDDVVDAYPYERYEVGDSGEEDELLSSPPGNRNQRMRQPGEALASLSTLTWQTSTIHHPPTATTPRPRTQTQHRAQPQHRNLPQHRNPPRPTRTPRPPTEPQQTPQRMDFAQDPAFFQALGQSIAQGIAQYMSSYQDSPRSTDPVWDAPPLPRPPQSARRPAPPPQRPRQMIPESPRQPSRSLWSTGRAVGRPRVQARPSAQIPEPSPSIRNTTLPRQILANPPPAQPRYAVPQWDGAEYEEEGEESFDELEENGQQGEDMGSIEYEDQEQVNTWAEDEEVMDLEPTTEVEDPTEATGIEDIKNPDLFQGPDDGPMKAQEFPASRNSPDPASMMPTNEVAGPTNTPAGRGNTQATPVAQPSPVGSTTETPGGTKVQKHKHHPAWIEGDNELFIVLKKDRKLSTSQICRYFPDRTVKNLENHWYKHLSRRAEEARGPMSDYVRRALERGPILANKVRQKPYKPKNLETARPHLANLTDPTELLQRYPTEVRDSESDSVAGTSQEVVTPTVQADTAAHSNQEVVATPAVQAPANELLGNTLSTSEGVQGFIVSTGDAKRPWACGRCNARWTSKKGAKYHFAVPERCVPFANHRTNRGRKPHHVIPAKAKPPKLVIPGVDITSGKPATFNPNILFREEMERTYLCVLCGKSWASHSNAREHTRKPETCIPENWLTNYQPGAHRKRALPVNGSAQEDRSSKRQKKDDSATRQLVEAAGGRAPEELSNESPVTAAVQRAAEARSQSAAQPVSNAQSTQEARPEPVSAPQRRLPKRFTISDKPSVVAGPSKQLPIDLSLIDPMLIDTSKVIEAMQQHMSTPQQVLGISPPALQISQGSAPKTTHGETSAAGAAAAARNRVGLSKSAVQTPPAPNQSALRTPIQQAPPSIQPQRSQAEDRPPSLATKRPKQVAGTGSTPRKGTTVASTSAPTTLVAKPSQKSSQRPDKIAGPSSTPRKGASAASSSVPATQAPRPLQKSSQLPRLVAGASFTPRSGVPAASSSASIPQASKPSQKSPQRPNVAVGASSTSRDGASAASSPAPAPQPSKSWHRPSLPKPVSKKIPDVRTKAASSKPTPSKPTTSKPTPSKPVPKSVGPQESQSARPASKASSTKRLPAKTGPSATPRPKVTGEAGRSSPLSRIAKSEPRPSTSFIDLLADESEDELAL